MDHLSIDEFKKLEIRIGEILSAEVVPDADRLLKLSVSFGTLSAPAAQAADQPPQAGLGEEDVRQIVSGIRGYFSDPSALVGKKVAFAYNLEPRVIKGFESQGMILAAVDEAGNFSLLESNATVAPGAKVK